ncbi:hypothetical protein [Streptomyces sp. CBMA152]|uniref:hypothetical protein n=1 Tax=Streptomyces sp. CBMA152 TaxID=1896312 RepID=UPI0016607D42|nr:hypothetical protein [Streptomyces sp. CBMA152]MBD0745961.1 hypothetical protein [Streptomyces sp. CBMA152]
MVPKQDKPSRTTDGSPRPRNRGGLIYSATLGVAFALIAAWLLLVNMPRALDSERDFRAAVDCPAQSQAQSRSEPPSDEDCLRSVPAHVDHTRDARRKTPTYWMYVKLADGTTDRARLEGSPGDLAGKQVHVRYWRGQIRAVHFADGWQSAYAEPIGNWRPFAAWGLGLGVFSTGFLWSAYWWARRSGSSPRANPWQVALPPAAALCVGGFAAVLAMLAGSVQDALLGTAGAVVVGLVACLLTGFVLARRGTEDDTVEVAPVVPGTGEEIFPGVVLGDVPYRAGNGGGFLVTGPGLFATTPDPTGAFARTSVPRTLVPQRVRRPYWTDPGGGDYPAETLVVECRDGETQVLVVTEKKNVGRVLGALETASGHSTTA